MKITGIKIYECTAPYEAPFPWEERSSGPLDIYEEYGVNPRNQNIRGAGGVKDGQMTSLFVAVTTDEGVEGIHGPIQYRSQLLVAVEGLAPHLIGRDPMETRMLWDIMSRFDRHSRSGLMLMAISAVDIALWDLKGKLMGQPVYKLLGGGRSRVRPYISALAFSVEPERAKERALWIRDQGFRGQKWFFRYGPADGTEGIRKNLDLAFTLREALGEGYELMFDCWMGWDIAYAKTVLRELEPVKPMWVEEVLRPHMLDGYRRLKAQTNVPLSAGEHLYTRMEVNEYLRGGIFDVIQSDPEWCGGITEALRIADLCEMYGTRFIPHGHSFLPAMHVVAAMAPDVCPYAECLLHIFESKTHYFRHKMMRDGYLVLNDIPGLGEDLDMERLTKHSEVKSFEIY